MTTIEAATEGNSKVDAIAGQMAEIDPTTEAGRLEVGNIWSVSVIYESEKVTANKIANLLLRKRFGTEPDNMILRGPEPSIGGVPNPVY